MESVLLPCAIATVISSMLLLLKCYHGVGSGVGGGGGGGGVEGWGEIDCYFCCHGGRVIYKESGYIVKNWEAIDGGYSLDDVRFMCDHCHIYDRFREKGPNARFF